MIKKNNKEAKEEKIENRNWNKRQYLLEQLSKRPRNFYIDTGNLFFKLSLIITCISLLMTLYTTYKVYNMPNYSSYYINSVDGKIYENQVNPEKFEKMKLAMAKIREKQQQDNKQKKTE